MKLLGLAVMAVLAVPLQAEKSVEIRETGKDRFEAGFPSGKQLRLHVRSGDVEVTGGTEDKIVITYGGTKADQGREVTVTLKRSEDGGELRVDGGPKNEFQIRIQVPMAGQNVCSL
jgi:hypothetical protein